MENFIKLDVIKNIIQEIMQEFKIEINQIYLFGSRARGDHGKFSDYDILVVVNENITIDMKKEVSKKIRKLLARKSIDADIIIKSYNEFAYLKDKVGSIVKYADREGKILL